MIDVKTADLLGPSLDWAVAKSEGIHVRVLSRDNIGEKWQVQKRWNFQGPYWPSQDWLQCGELIGRSITTMCSPRDGYWWAHARGPLGERLGEGDTALIAACRAIVAANLGDSVQIPAELRP